MAWIMSCDSAASSAAELAFHVAANRLPPITTVITAAMTKPSCAEGRSDLGTEIRIPQLFAAPRGAERRMSGAFAPYISRCLALAIGAASRAGRQGGAEVAAIQTAAEPRQRSEPQLRARAVAIGVVVQVAGRGVVEQVVVGVGSVAAGAGTEFTDVDAAGGAAEQGREDGWIECDLIHRIRLEAVHDVLVGRRIQRGVEDEDIG